MAMDRTTRRGLTRKSAVVVLVGALGLPLLSAAPALAGPGPKDPRASRS